MDVLLHSPFDFVPSPPSDRMARFVGELTSRTEDDFVNACAAVGVARKLAQDPMTIALLSELGERLEALAAIQRTLRLPSEPVLDLGEILQDLCSHMVDARFGYRGIFVQVRTGAIPMDGRKAWAVLIIVSELFLHTHRRGLEDEPGLISVEASEQDGVVTCRFRDDGSASHYLEAEEMRLGRSSLAMIAEEIGGSLDYSECPRGTVVVVRVPPARAAGGGFFDRLRAAFCRPKPVQRAPDPGFG